MGLRNLMIKAEYRLPTDNVVRDFYIPLLKEAACYKRAVGFFSSSALVEITKGISGLVKNGGKIYLIATPFLTEEDILAIQEGYKGRKEVIENCLYSNLLEPQNFFEEERLNLLANLIATGVLEIKIALIENEHGLGMYHEKLGLISDKQEDTVAFTGSMNESSNAFYNNYESVDVFCSWTFDEERVKLKKGAFAALWNNYEPHIDTIAFPELNDNIIKKYKRNDIIDTNLDEKQYGHSNYNMSRAFIKMPSGIKLKDYQENAIGMWIEKQYCGIYDMATGTGKTFTALGSLARFEEAYSKFAVFVVCPYIHLVNQWEEDALEWGVTPIIAHSQAENKAWPQLLVNAYKRFRITGKPFMCITTNTTFTGNRIQNVIKNIGDEIKCVLIIDEMHNFGATKLSKFLPDNIKFRLGLSATVERHMDKYGTQVLYNYFGEKCIEYPIERAIDEEALVKYEYYPIVVSLQDDELVEYRNLSKQISRYIIKKNGRTTISEIGQQLLFKRARIIAGAENKLDTLMEKLADYRDKKHILIYCGATRGFEEYKGQKERQIDRVEKIVGNQLNMSTHRFTSEENAKTRKLLKEGFTDGEYQVLTAIKCLDEGVNIPNIETAFILASSRNPKEFIQRRGRVLRTFHGKTRAVIYDFVTLPHKLNEVRFGDFDDDEAIVIGEMARIYEFGRCSVNFRLADDLLNEIKEAYCIEINNDDLNSMMEDAYGEEHTEY